MEICRLEWVCNGVTRASNPVALYDGRSVNPFYSVFDPIAHQSVDRTFADTSQNTYLHLLSLVTRY